MKKTIYRGKSEQDLRQALEEKREALRKLKFGSTGSKARNVKGAASARKEIARIMTELNSSTTLTTSK